MLTVGSKQTKTSRGHPRPHHRSSHTLTIHPSTSTLRNCWGWITTWRCLHLCSRQTRTIIHEAQWGVSISKLSFRGICTTKNSLMLWTIIRIISWNSRTDNQQKNKRIKITKSLIPSISELSWTSQLRPRGVKGRGKVGSALVCGGWHSSRGTVMMDGRTVLVLRLPAPPLRWLLAHLSASWHRPSIASYPLTRCVRWTLSRIIKRSLGCEERAEKAGRLVGPRSDASEDPRLWNRIQLVSIMASSFL